MRWATDTPLIAGSAAAIVWIQLAIDDAVSPSCPCRSSEVPGVDRWIIGRHSQAARLTSDLIVGTMIVLPFALDATDVWRSGGAWTGFFADAVVLSEAMLISGAVNQLVKFAARRPRPLTYDRAAGDPLLAEPDNYLSFYSSHTATTFAAGMSYATTFALRHPASPARFLVYGAAAAAGGTVALMRMLAGKHFPTDVMVGAVAGGTIGVVVPRLHRRTTIIPVAAPLPGGGAGLALTGRF